jgi:hypothetical protein
MSNPMTSNLTNLLTAILVADVFSILCTIGITTETGLEALIGQYSVMGAVILIILILKTKGMINSGIIDKMSILITAAPFLFLLFLIIYYIVLVSIYFTNIVSNKISNYYYMFSKISTGLILGQVLLLVYTMAKTVELPKKIFTILMLLGTINAIVLITLGIVLKFYTTDC